MFDWQLSSFQKTLQMVANCAGSLINHAALLSGRTTGKIRNLISMQVAANPIVSQFNELKAGILIPGTLERLGVSGMDASPDSTVHVTDKLFNALIKNVSENAIKYKERCQNTVCHR